MDNTARKKSPTKTLVLIALFTALIVVGTKITIPIFFIPFTLQVFFIVLAGKIGGKIVGLSSVVIFIALGLTGIPVFATGGGFDYAIRPTFGYILGFIPLAVLSGVPHNARVRSFSRELLWALVGDLTMYAVAVPYLYMVTTLVLGGDDKLADLLMSGFFIFIPSDFVQCLLASIIAVKLRPILKI